MRISWNRAAKLVLAGIGFGALLQVLLNACIIYWPFPLTLRSSYLFAFIFQGQAATSLFIFAIAALNSGLLFKKLRRQSVLDPLLIAPDGVAILRRFVRLHSATLCASVILTLFACRLIGEVIWVGPARALKMFLGLERSLNSMPSYLGLIAYCIFAWLGVAFGESNHLGRNKSAWVVSVLIGFAICGTESLVELIVFRDRAPVVAQLVSLLLIILQGLGVQQRITGSTRS